MVEVHVGEYKGGGYGIALKLPKLSMGVLQPIEVSSNLLDDMTPGERHVLGYNVAREVRRVEELAGDREAKVWIVLPLAVRDFILARSFSQQINDLIKLQNRIGERTDGRHVSKQVPRISD